MPQGIYGDATLLLGVAMVYSCRACGRPVPASAALCPHCGAAGPAAGARPVSAVTPSQSWHVHFERALEYLAGQDYSTALAEISQAIISAPESDLGKCYATRGYTHLCLGDCAQAVEDCTQGIALDPFDAEAYAWRGSAYAAQHQWRATLDDYQAAIRLAPESAAEYYEIATAHALHAVSELTQLERQKHLPPQAFQDRAVAQAFLGQMEEATRDFTTAIKHNAQDAVSFFKRAECYAALSQYDKVVADCKAAASLGMRTPELYFLRGLAHRHLGHADSAIADFTKVLNCDGQHVAAYYERGKLRQARGEAATALQDFSAAIALAPDVAEYYASRASVQANLGNAAAAVEDYSVSLEWIPADIATLLARGHALLACQRAEEALYDFDTTLAIDPTFASALVGRGAVFAQQGHFDAAVSEFSKAIRLSARSAEAFAGRGKVFLEQQRYDQAIADLGRAIELETQTQRLADLHYRRGLAYLDVGKPEKAVLELDHAIALRPGDADALAWRGSARGHLHQWRGALDDIAAAIENNPAGRGLYDELGIACAQAAINELTSQIATKSDDGALLIQRAIAHDFLHHGQAALADYNAAIKLQAQDADAFYRRGHLLASNQKHEHALADFQRALQLDPRHAGALRRRALSHRQLGKLDAALADLNAAIAVDATNPRLHRDRAILLATLGKHEEALASYNQAIASKIPAVEIFYERGLSLLALGKPQAALADFDTLLEQDSWHARALHQRGEAHLQLKNVRQALADFDAALAIDPNLVAAHCSRALTLVRSGHHHLAILDLTKAIARVRQDNAFAAALATRARIFYSMGHFQRAALDYTFVVQLRPQGHNFAHTFYGRGLAMLQLGDIIAAERNFAKAVELSPTFKPAKMALAWIRGDRRNVPAELRPPNSKVALAKPAVLGPAVIVAAAHSDTWRTDPLWDQWLVRTNTGEEFGPVQKSELNLWCGEGRLHPSHELLRLNWDEWRPATEIYPELFVETQKAANRPVPAHLAPPQEEVIEVFEVVESEELNANDSSPFADFAKQLEKPASAAPLEFPDIKF